MTLIVASLYLMKSIAAVIVIFFVTQVRGLTPRWPFDWEHHQILEKLFRACICVAWLVVMIENIYGSAALMLGERVLDMPEPTASAYMWGQLATVVVLAHFAWLAWRADHRRLI